MSKLALQLIEDAKQNNSKFIDLGRCGLTEIPQEVFALTHLEELLLCNMYWDPQNQKWVESANQGPPNRIRTIPKAIKALKNLSSLRIGGDYKYGHWGIKNGSNLIPLEQLTLLDLSINNISDASFLQNLPTLTLLDLRSNNISDTSFLQNLPALNSLDLRFNNISDIAFLQNLPALTSLDLSSNKISDISFLQNLSALTSLHLSANNISDISFLQNFSTLRSLDLSINKQITDFSFLQNLSALTSLNLRYNNISDIAFLQNLSALTSLDLSSNKISDIAFLQNLPALTSLYLRLNKISDISFLQNLPALTSLDLSKNNITDISFLQNLSSLTLLDLSKNNITDIAFLQNLSSLTSLDLSINKISDISFLQNLSALNSLDLSFNKQITDFSFLQNLSSLTSISLSSNKQITDFSFLQNLSGLTVLELSSNNISDIAFLQNLPALTSLYLSSNKQITDFSFLQNLSSLTSLYLSSNNISDISFLQNLPALTVLELSSNNLSDISFLQNLSGLTWLDLSDNKISDIQPILQLIKKGISVKWENNFLGNGIFTANNPWSIPPVEIVKQGNEAILRYFEELEKSGETSIKEAKLLLTGSGEVGKTSLRYRIKNKSCALPHKDDRTKQVDIDTYSFTINISQETFTAHVWDFGGQQIIHHFHRFFMNDSALYLLLTETSRENDDFDYWLQSIQLYGKDSPILFVQNKRNGMPRSLDIKPYQQHFNIKDELYNVNLLTNEGLEELEKAIQYHIQRLPLTQRTIPKSWLRIREALEEFKSKSKRHFITYPEFIEICRKKGEIDTRIGIEDVGQFLHNLGVVLWYHDNPTLRQKIILERHWATEGIFKLIFDEHIQNTGHFTFLQAQTIWDKDLEYSHHAKDLIEMMREFSICFPQKNQPDHYIIPALLSATGPKVAWQYTNQMTVEYHYETILPRGLVNYLTAEMYDYISEDTHAWSAGVWLHKDDTQAKIEENRFRRKIRIELGGQQTRELFAIIKKEIDDIHRAYSGIEAELMIPCICSQCATAPQDKVELFKYTDILRRLKHPKKRTITCNISLDDITAEELLNNVLPKSSFQENPPNQKTTKIFVSYAHKDLSFRVELENRLKPLLRQKEITELWYDHKITAGQNWDKEIEHNLKTADIIILLISDDFWASDYIDQKELPIIQERYDNNECVIIPLIVRINSYWEGNTLQAIQAIPTDPGTGKLTAIDKWVNKDEAWKEIISGIKGLL